MLGRRVASPRRVVLAVELPGGVRVVDPAIDESSDLKAYAESMYDERHLRLREGQRPTYWGLQPLTRRQKDFSDGLGTRAKATWYVRCALTSCDGYTLDGVEGSQTLPPVERAADGPYGHLVTERWLDQADFPEEQLYALWIMARTISEAPLPLSKPSVTPSGDGRVDG